MAFEFSSIRAAYVAIGLGVLSCLSSANATPSVPSVEPALAPGSGGQCDDGCISGMMAAARQGRPVDQLLLIARATGKSADNMVSRRKPMRRPNPNSESIAVGNVDVILAKTLRDTAQDYGVIPEYRRVLALVYLKANQAPQAERELRNAIAVFPTHSPFWVDLAIALSMQGKAEDAIAALVVAETWSGDPKGLREAYGQAARTAPVKGMAEVYQGALDVLAANDALLQRIDAELPPISGNGAVLGEDGKPVWATVSFNNCVKPEWPRSSLRYEETGSVTLAFFVDADGKLLRAKKQISSGHVELDNAAFVALAACAFKPPVVAGKPTAAWMKLQYVWSLE